MAPLNWGIEGREATSWRAVSALESANEVTIARGNFLDEELSLKALVGMELGELRRAQI